MRSYITTVKLYKYNSNIPDMCFKCRENQGTFKHCIRECNKINAFWKEVANKIMTILSIIIPVDSKMILLHLYPTNLKLRSREYEFIDFAILQAKQLIALNWKKTSAPTIGAWINGTVYVNGKDISEK